ncbi:hypothetical protein GUF49_08160, partial [Xanthomonas citri pv. citri]|nr:hypothetical protein [Xanthomonas citri pv. citri]
MNWNCFTAAYNSLEASCKLYFRNTPYTMGLDPYLDVYGSIFIKKIALYPRLHREADNLFYFVS